jgi:uncharacterized protein YgbK (DUF1537 family)
MTLADTLAPYPPPRRIAGARRAIHDALVESRTKLVVVDDDPTGTQTVHGVRVYMEWSVETLLAALARPEPLFYLSTNSRSLARGEAVTLAHGLGRNLRTAAERSGTRIVIASRSDSTLRGHFPAEVDALASEIPGPVDGILLVPAFFDAGRYTIDNIHWVEIGGELVPAHQTEFAHDPDFGFTHSDLRQWVQEKTGGAVPAGSVMSVSLDQLRRETPAWIGAFLAQARGGGPVVANAASDEDLEVLALGVQEAEKLGKKFIYRTGASFVKVRGGVEDRPLLTRREMSPCTGAGLIVAGSWVARTTAQIEELVASRPVAAVEISAALLQSDSTRTEEVERAASAVTEALRKNVTVLLSTSRARLQTSDFLAGGKRIMSGLCDVVTRIAPRPGFVVAKGGITSIEIARTALGCSQAEVLGQVLKGVPVWKLGAGSRWSDVPYVVFPGNVGDGAALLKVVETLAG